MQSVFGSESVRPSDRLTPFPTKDYILSPSLEINSNWYSISSIESSFTIPLTESASPWEPTPIHWPTVSIESDKNSIYRSLSSFSIPSEEDVVSTDKPFITAIESSFRLISVSTTPSIQTMDQKNKTIDSLKSSGVSLTTTIPTTTPIPVPLCPESLQTQSPRESLDKPFEDYLIRTGISGNAFHSFHQFFTILMDFKSISDIK